MIFLTSFLDIVAKGRSCVSRNASASNSPWWLGNKIYPVSFGRFSRPSQSILIRPALFTFMVNFRKQLAGGPYSRAVKTGVGGHVEKMINSGYQHIRLDKHGSDCGTTDYVTELLTDSNEIGRAHV